MKIFEAYLRTEALYKIRSII